MHHPRLRHALTVGAGATAATTAVITFLYHLGRCLSTSPHDTGATRCINAREHLTDHIDRAGRRWDDQDLIDRRMIAGVMLSTGAVPTDRPVIIRGPLDVLRRIAYTRHPAETRMVVDPTD